MPVFVRSTNSFAVMCGRLPGGVGADDQLIRHLLGECDELGQRVDTELRRTGHHQALVRRQADRDHVSVDVEWQVLLLRRQDHVDRCQGRKQRIAVGLLAQDGAGADDATPAGAVLDNHLLAPQLRQRLCDEPMADVRRGAGRQWHNHLHRARRIGLGRCRSGGGQAEAGGGHAGQKRAFGEHCGPPRLRMQLCRPQ
jgi:hypothetical protein